MTEFTLEVTDLKQYTCCPRIVFYRYCLPRIRPVTILMEEGIQQHDREEDREARRSLKHYGVQDGERISQVSFQSAALSLSGRLDLAIITTDLVSRKQEAIVVEYKYSEQKVGAHYKLQLAAYALLLEEAWNIPVRQGFVYSIPLRKAEPIAITTQLRNKVKRTIADIQHIVVGQSMPDPTKAQARCVSCEFRRFCNDII